MRNEVLLIPEKTDIERDSVANSWERDGGEVIRVGRFWEKPNFNESNRITIYGPDTFSLVLAQVINVGLILPDDKLIAELDTAWVKREIKILRIEEVGGLKYPTFIKPVKPKTFKSKVYFSYSDLQEEIAGIDKNEQIIQSDLIEITKEVRAYILDDTILDLAFYEGSGELNKPRKFLTDFLLKYSNRLEKSFVVDLGYNELNEWFIIEFNSSWGAGLNSCKAEKVIRGIREATIN